MLLFMGTHLRHDCTLQIHCVQFRGWKLRITNTFLKVKSVISQPEVLLAEVGNQVSNEQEGFETGDLDKEIKELSRRMKGMQDKNGD